MTDTGIKHDRPANTGLHFEQIGETGRFVGLSFKIFFLSLVTLTVYRFWGRNEIRRALWTSTVIDGEPLDYTGTGLELFIGAIIAVLIYVLPLSALFWVVLQFLPPPQMPAPGTPGMPNTTVLVMYAIGFVALLYLTPVAIYQALRYRLSRTQWRGIRFSLEGSAFLFGLKFFGFVVANYFTLGWLSPVMEVSIFRTIANNLRFGDQPFRFEGKAGPLYGPFALAYIFGVLAFAAPAVAGVLAQQGTLPRETAGMIGLGSVVAFFLAMFFVLAYVAASLRVLAGGLRFQGLSFHLDAGAWSYFWLLLSNGLIAGFSLGILLPVTELRRYRYIFNRLSATGSHDLGAIGPSTGPRPRFGEGLAEVFGFGNV